MQAVDEPSLQTERVGRLPRKAVNLRPLAQVQSAV